MTEVAIGKLYTCTYSYLAKGMPKAGDIVMVVNILNDSLNDGRYFVFEFLYNRNIKKITCRHQDWFKSFKEGKHE